MEILRQWQGALYDVLFMLTGKPESTMSFTIYILVSYLCCRWAFIRVVHTMNMNDLGVVRFHLSTLLGLTAILAPMVALKIYMPDRYDSPDQLMYLLAIVGGGSIVLSVPLINAMLKENYFKTLMAWGVSLLAIVVTVVVLNMIAGGVESGKAAYKKGYERNEETSKVINGKPAKKK
ncbi:MAG TPA: hypothetical protein VIH35_08420 [Kiritimatiellia bacterium]|jgi:peptidoglycan/LPS O-acetylase OafA/YrhL